MVRAPLTDSIRSDLGAVQHTQDYHAAMELLIPRLKTSQYTAVIEVEPSLSRQFIGDFSGLLLRLAIPQQYHWCVMRVNDLHSPSEFTGNIFTLVVPKFEEVDNYTATYTSSAKLNIG